MSFWLLHLEVEWGAECTQASHGSVTPKRLLGGHQFHLCGFISLFLSWPLKFCFNAFEKYSGFSNIVFINYMLYLIYFLIGSLNLSGFILEGMDIKNNKAEDNTWYCMYELLLAHNEMAFFLRSTVEVYKAESKFQAQYIEEIWFFFILRGRNLHLSWVLHSRKYIGFPLCLQS